MVWPTRGQKAPNFWDEDLKDYVDQGNPAVPGSEAAELLSATYVGKASALAAYTSADEAGTAAFLAGLDPGTPYLITQADPFDIFQGVTA